MPSYWPVDGDQPGGMWVGTTFHVWRTARCARIIWTLIAASRFSTARSECVWQARLIKEAMNLDEKQWPPRQACSTSIARKTKGYARTISKTMAIRWNRRQKVYQVTYQESVRRAGLVDFAELLLRARRTMKRTRPHILQHYRERFTNIGGRIRDTSNIRPRF